MGCGVNAHDAHDAPAFPIQAQGDGPGRRAHRRTPHRASKTACRATGWQATACCDAPLW